MNCKNDMRLKFTYSNVQNREKLLENGQDSR